MWCQWVKSYLIKGRNFWNLKMPSNPSWTWRKLLNLRPLVQPHIITSIVNGHSTSLWFDNWHPLGPLVVKFGTRIMYDAGLPQDTSIGAILHHSRWTFPITQTWELNEIRNNLPSPPSPSIVGEDQVKWALTTSGQFTISSMWENLRTHYPKV